MSDPVHALFVASDEEECTEVAAALEEAGEGELRVAGATSVEAVRDALAEGVVDCVVFGEDEDPLSPDGVQLLDVVELCTAPPDASEGRTVPLILYSDGTYPLSTAKATDGVTDYVQANVDDALTHLANRLRWTASAEGDDAAWYKRIVESMEDGVLTFDESGRIQYANEAMADAFGLRQEAFEETPPSELAEWGLIPEEDAADLTEAVRAIVQGGVNARAREVTITPSIDDVDRRVVEFQIVGMPGEASGVIATVRGITEYKRIENALRTTSTKVERLSEAIDAIRETDSPEQLFETTVRVVSQFVEADVCGIDSVEGEEFVPRVAVGGKYGPSSTTEGADARAVREGESNLVTDPAPEDTPLDDAGSLLHVPIEKVGLLRAASAGQFSERDRGLAETLAEHAAETLERIRGERDVDEARSRLWSVYENVPLPIASYAFEDGEPILTSVNSEFEETFGVTANEAVGEALDEYVRPPDDEAAAPAEDTADLTDVLRSDRHAQVPIWRQTTSGVREFRLYAGPSAADAEDGYLVFEDVTERQQSQRIRRQQTQRLERIESIATDALRDHLNEARGYLELATETQDPDDMAAVDEAHDQIQGLVEDVQNLAGQKPELDRELVDLGTAVGRAWARVDTGEASVGAEDEQVLADPALLTDLLEQVFRNAVDHAGDTSALTVQVGALEGGFYVEDTATTVPGSLRNRKLEDASDAIEEGASRLAAIQQTATAHGWVMRVDTNEYGGSRFAFVEG